jgi:hypothetical protein
MTTREREPHYSEQQSPEIQQTVHMKMDIYAETCSEIVSNKGTTNDVAETSKSDVHSATGC